MKSKVFIGKKVVGMSDGAEIGKVKDLIFTGLKLTGLVVKGDRGEGLLPYDSLGANGSDAMTVESYAVSPGDNPTTARRVRCALLQGSDSGKIADFLKENMK